MQSRSPFFSVLCALAFLFFSSPGIQAQSSTLNSPALEPIWQTLLRATSDLPTLIDAYTASWTQQVESLQDSNALLQTSVEILESQNADLQISLIRSRADLAISEQEQARSAKLLDDSMLHITQAQVAAKALEAENAILKYGMIGAAAVAVVAVIVAAVR
jgi:hypothetical protein